MRFSIITVSYNADSTIRRTIESVLNQDFDSFEYIVVDGSSTDRTTDILAEYIVDARFKYYSEPDNGIYDAMNKGLRLASGDFLIFMGADDIFYNQQVLSSINNRIKHNDKVYYGNVILSKENQVYNGEFRKWEWGYQNICHQSIFYPLCVYKNYVYDERYKLVADWVYNLTLIKDHVNFDFIDVIVSVYNTDGISSIKNDNLFLKNRKQLIVDAVGVIPYTYGLIVRLFRRSCDLFNKMVCNNFI